MNWWNFLHVHHYRMCRNKRMFCLNKGNTRLRMNGTRGTPQNKHVFEVASSNRKLAHGDVHCWKRLLRSPLVKGDYHWSVLRTVHYISTHCQPNSISDSFHSAWNHCCWHWRCEGVAIGPRRDGWDIDVHLNRSGKDSKLNEGVALVAENMRLHQTQSAVCRRGQTDGTTNNKRPCRNILSTRGAPEI